MLNFVLNGDWSNSGIKKILEGFGINLEGTELLDRLDSPVRMEFSIGLFQAVFIWLSMEFSSGCGESWRSTSVNCVMSLVCLVTHQAADGMLFWQQSSSLLNLNCPLYN